MKIGDKLRLRYPERDKTKVKLPDVSDIRDAINMGYIQWGDFVVIERMDVDLCNNFDPESIRVILNGCIQWTVSKACFENKELRRKMPEWF